MSFIKNKSTYKQYKKYISTTKEDWENYFLPLNEINSESEDNQLVCKYTNNELKIYKWWSPKIWPEKLPSLTKLKNKISTIKELEKEEFISNLLFSMPRMIGPKRDSLFTREQISYLYHLMCNSVK
ncbi:hypothetical protein [Metamycoplasma arthritidis]|uniref:hypothetical protein n=1 Tax=Metamycoplasma arthritidis TaxID=2111 RepID=UPI0011D0587E|nr:hypothetical protein [Metamycoplasma arthritidis]